MCVRKLRVIYGQSLYGGVRIGGLPSTPSRRAVSKAGVNIGGVYKFLYLGHIAHLLLLETIWCPSRAKAAFKNNFAHFEGFQPGSLA